MQRMYPLDLKALRDEHQHIEGLFLEKVRQLSLVDFVLDFSKNQNIFISLNSNFPFVCFNSDLSEFPSGGELHSFAIDLRRFLNGRLVSVRQPNDDMVLALDFEQRNNLLEKEIFTLYIELIPNHPQEVLTNSEDKILAAYRYNNERGKDGRLIRRNNIYSLPNIVTNKSPKKLGDFDYLKTYLYAFGERIKKQNYRVLYVYLEHNIKRLEKLVRNYKLDLTKIHGVAKLYEHANLLLMNKPQIEGESVQIEGEIISVDPRYSALQNAEMLFKKAKKLKKSEEILKERIEQSVKEIEYLSSIYQMLHSVKTSEEFSQIFEELNLQKPNVKTHIKSSLLPYFVTYKNTRILFGRNNKQNDHLSFKIAKKIHTFVHIRNVPGAHIIIEESNPSKDMLEYAGKLALYLSKKVDGDVTYAKVSDIKKGQFPGQVILRHEKTFFVRLDEKESTNFKNTIKRLI
ncbi:MAG: NFACT family protein [Bacilli bacterium]|nr:NFACT family protein [Bacilli bacterium]